MRKTPAQLLFDRIVRTWIVPEASRRAQETGVSEKIPLRVALILFEQGGPRVLLNEEVVSAVVRKIEITLARPVEKDQWITPEDIGGVQKVILDHRFRRDPFIYVTQGSGGRYFGTGHDVERALAAPALGPAFELLKTEGVRLTGNTVQLEAYIDLCKEPVHWLSFQKAQGEQGTTCSVRGFCR